MSDWTEWELHKTGSLLTGFDITHKTDEEQYLEVTFYKGEDDGKPVIQVDGSGDFRINVNDGHVWDQHTEATRNYFPDPEDALFRNSMILQAALHMYHTDAGSADHHRSYDLAQLHQLRTELIRAGIPENEVDCNGTLEPLGSTDVVAVRIEGELKEHDSFDEVGYDVRLFHLGCFEEGYKLFDAIDEEDHEVRRFELDGDNLPECPVCEKVIGNA